MKPMKPLKRRRGNKSALVTPMRAVAAASTDGRLWELWYAATASPDAIDAYIADALNGQRDGRMLRV